MEDLIKRADAIDEIRKSIIPHDIACTYYSNLCINTVRRVPSADRQGHWIVITLYVQGKEPKSAVRCSECKRIPMWLGSPILPTKSGNLLEYCPHCGTHMKGTDDE